MSFKEITTALGSNDQLLGVSHTGSTLEYKTITSGSGISVVSTAGTITISSTAGASSGVPVTAGGGLTGLFTNSVSARAAGFTLAPLGVDPSTYGQGGLCCVGSDGKIYVPDLRTATNGVYVYNPLTNTVTNIPFAGTSLRCLCLGPDGNIWILDYTGSTTKFWVVTPSGSVTLAFTYSNAFTGICTGPDGNFYAVNGASSIYQITPTGTVSSGTLGGGIAAPIAICLGPDNNLWCADNSYGCFWQVTTSLVGTKVFTNGYPVSICVGGDGRLWGACETNTRVVVSSTAGVVAYYPLTVGATNYAVSGCCLGFDGNVWLTTYATATSGNCGFLSISSSGSTVTFYAQPTIYQDPLSDHVRMCAGNGFVAAVGYLGSGQSQVVMYQPAAEVLNFNPSYYITSSFSNTGFTSAVATSGVVAFDTAPDGSVWTCDQNTGTNGVYRYDPTSKSVINVPFAGNSLYCPNFGPDGNLYVLDTSILWKINPLTYKVTSVTSPVTTPHTMCIGSDGNAWLFGSSTVTVINPTTGTTVATYAGTSQVSSACLAPDGNIWFVCTGINKVYKLTPAGVLTFVTKSTSDYVNVICVGPDGNLWIGGSYGNFAQVTTAGVVTTFPITSPQFSFFGLAASPDGNLYGFGEPGGSPPIGILQLTTAGTYTAYKSTSTTLNLDAQTNTVPCAVAWDGSVIYANGTGIGVFNVPSSGTISYTPTGSPLPNKAQALVNFGSPYQEDFNATVTVSAPWVQATSVIICSSSGIATVDHDPDDYLADQIQAYATNIVPGVSFDVVAVAPSGTWGRYLINTIGVS